MDPSDILGVDRNQIISKKHVISTLKDYTKTKLLLPLEAGNFDKVLGGGFHLNEKYLLFGANKTGKTQICLNLCVQAYKYFRQSNLNKNPKLDFIYFLDCENTFRPERITEIAHAKSLDYQDVLKYIKVSKIMSNSALLLKLNEIENQLKGGNNTLLVIDSINNFFRLDQGNKEISFFKLKSTFLKILTKINEFANTHDIVTICTAQIFPNFDETAIIKELPVGNQYLNHFFSEYIYLHYKDDINYAHLVNSNSLPERRVAFNITSNGIVDHKI